MQDASSRLVDILERLTTDMAELTELAVAISIPEAQKASLRAILQQFYFILEQQDIESPEPQSVTQVPVFNANDLARTIHTAASDEIALRTVMLSTDIPLHWNTIYARIYPLIKAQLRPPSYRLHCSMSDASVFVRINNILARHADAKWVQGMQDTNRAIMTGKYIREPLVTVWGLICAATA
jgi:hypothetical protein